MSRKIVYVVAGAAALLLLFVPSIAGSANEMATPILGIADQLVSGFEGFRSTPYWDVSRWSWGYGTAAPGPDGTISEADAFAAMQQVNDTNYNTLFGNINRTLNANQWGALLSFAYNEGAGNAENLVDDINSGNDAVLEPHWKKYVYAGGVVNADLISRRTQEWQVWTS